jgi:tetratricopeptide (TPR) repeat protein
MTDTRAGGPDRNRRRVLAGVGGVWLSVSLAAVAWSIDAGPSSRGTDGSTGAAAVDAQRVAQLIERLGADDFAAREKAQSELAQLGLEAYDALFQAQSHHDPEIALRARYLVRSMNVRWFSQGDPPKVVALLKDYSGDLPEAERRSRIDRLAALEQGMGLVPLVRLARFETSDVLAKYAALRLMEQPPPEEPVRQALVEAIGRLMAHSQRPTAVWLRLVARTLREPEATLDEWKQAVQREQALFSSQPERSSPECVRDLFRYYLELLSRCGREAEAMDVARQTFALVDGTPEQIQEAADWLMHRRAYGLALELLERFDAVVREHPRLLYRRAAAQQHRGATEQALRTAASALALAPENLDDHLLTGRWIEEQLPGFGHWAEQEYRQVIAKAPPGSRIEFMGRFRLSELLHDRLLELQAAQTLQAVVDRMEQDETAKDTCRSAGRMPESVLARMHYFYAAHYHAQGDYARERKHLEQAIEADDTDADVLIAMFRWPQADEAWKTMTRQRIDSAAQGFRAIITDRKAAIDQADSETLREDNLVDYAIACNQYAWLVSNTVGDYEDALRLSQDAVRLSGQLVELKSFHAGFLDTLGRCYYACDDLPNAILHQSQAVALAPDSGQIRRQLEFFRQEAQQRGIPVPKPAATAVPPPGPASSATAPPAP